MRRFVFASLLLCIFAAVSFAQTPITVTATIIDPNGLPYTNAQVQANLVGIPPSQTATILVNGNPTQIGGQYNVTADATGKFSMNLFCNVAGSGCSLISPSGTSWQFTVMETGIAPPAGTGPQAFSVTLSISGASGLSQNITSQLNTSAPALGRAGASLAPPNVINPTLAPYNTPLTQSCANLNVTLTIGSNVVGCSTANYTAADIGKVYFVSCCGGLGGQNKASSVLVVTQGVIHDIIDSQHVHICTTTGTCTPVNSTANTANGTLAYWGFKTTNIGGTGPLQQAIAATYAGPGPCSQLFWSGIFMVDQAIGNGPAGCIQPIGATQDTNLSIQGTGRANSLLLMTPDFNFSSCTPICFFGLQGIERKYFGINGGGRSNTGTNNVILLDALVDDFDFDVGISDIGAQDTAMIAYQMDGSGAYPNFVEVDGAGNTPIKINSGTTNVLQGGYAADVLGTNVAGRAGCMQVAAGQVNTNLFYFGPPNASGAHDCITVASGAVWTSTNDFGIGGAGTNIINNVGGEIHLNNFSNPTSFGLTADRAIFQSAATAKTYVVNSRLFGTVNPIANSGGATLFTDDWTTYGGGGTITGLAPSVAVTGAGTTPTITISSGSTNERGGFVLTPGGTGITSTGSITLTFAGNNFTAFGNSPWSVCNFRASNAGTGAWNARVSFIDQVLPAITTYPTTWDNNAVALTSGSTYFVNWLCKPK